MRRRIYEPESLGGNWTLRREWRGSWTAYRVFETDEGGYIKDGHYAEFCRKKDALEYHKQHSTNVC